MTRCCLACSKNWIAVPDSTTNDEVRSLWMGILKEAVDTTDKYIVYLKFKNWLKVPPLYPYVPVQEKEKLDTAEAYHLWDHLTFRNDNIEETQRYYSFAEDTDLKTLLKEGLQGVLQQQAQILEGELRRFGIPLPVRPPRVIAGEENPLLLKDDNMFRHLFKGVQGATTVHAQAFKKCTTNDRVRKIFKDLLLEEVEIFDRLVSFGKYKGWLNPAPIYKSCK